MPPDLPMPARPLAHSDYLARTYSPELDGLRAVAVLLVITCHAQGHTFAILSGFLGVTVFFVLSGYLITTLALREEDRRGRVHLGAFYVRRTFRIFPLYYLALGLYAVYLFGFANKPSQAAFMVDYWPHYTFYFQEVAYADARAAGRDMPFTQSWSLGVEEKFYLLWPALAFVALAARPRWRLPAAGLLMALLAACPWTLLPAGFQSLTDCLVPYSQILAGCVLALWLHDPAGYEAFQRVRRRVGGVGVVGTWAVAHLGMQSFAAVGYGAAGSLVYLFATTLMVAEVVAADGLFHRLLRWGPMTLMGRLSYGMYLLHLLPMYAGHKLAKYLPWEDPRPFVTVAIAVAGSMAVAWVCAVTVEKPLIRVGRRLSDRLTRSGGPEVRTMKADDSRLSPAGA